MPLNDHFRPPWSIRRPWEGFHSGWAAAIAFHLNGGLLPSEYYAMPLVQVSGRVEVDVAALHEKARTGSGGTAVWSPPRPRLTLPLDTTGSDLFEVQVLRNFGGPQLRAVIELVSPANKDRPGSRRGFAAKCAGYVCAGVSVIVVDIVTESRGKEWGLARHDAVPVPFPSNLHADIMHALEGNGTAPWESPSHLYAVAYRSVVGDGPPRLEAWPHELRLGGPLPEMPLWLEADLCLPLRLEESYQVTYASLRMGG